jgi:hypothetical protein
VVKKRQSSEFLAPDGGLVYIFPYKKQVRFMGKQTEHDLERCFAMAAKEKDTDDFLRYIASSEIDHPQIDDDPHTLAERAAARVLAVMEVLGRQSIPSIRETSNDLAAKVIAEDCSSRFQYADAVRDTAKEAWDHGLAALNKESGTTLVEMVTKLSIF